MRLAVLRFVRQLGLSSRSGSSAANVGLAASRSLEANVGIIEAGPQPAADVSSAWAGPCSSSWSLTFAAGYAKGRGSKAAASAKSKEAEASTPDFDMDKVEKNMSLALQHFQTELTKIRTGRANPGLLEPIMVETTHERCPLRNVGTVTQRNPHLLIINPFNEKDMEAVAKAVRDSPLQLQARVEGAEIHVPVPRPTGEMLLRMSKLVHQEAETAKAAVRHSRHQGLDIVKKAFKDLPDERFRLDKEVQKLCDRFVADIERLKLAKEKDLKENH